MTEENVASSPAQIKHEVYKVLRDHEGAATRFCKTCIDYVPMDLDIEDKINTRMHQIEMLWKTGLLNESYLT